MCAVRRGGPRAGAVGRCGPVRPPLRLSVLSPWLGDPPSALHDDAGGDVGDEDRIPEEEAAESAAAAAAGPTTVEAKAALLSPAGRERLAAKVKALPLRFEAALSARHLRLDAVPALLSEYRELAALLREVERGDFDL
mmetsp:Transcript_21690/g.74537  ORF Transcript_21690/g.74537 Transcript_21690/m.74537 type:complete len:138 (-) Transcript_21690:35-448(-)